MNRPCVAVAREDGEAARKRLATADLVDGDHEITVEDGTLYVPVTDPDAVPESFPVVVRDIPPRETQQTPEELLSFSPTYERLGRVVVLDEDDPNRARAAAEAVMMSDVTADTVVNRASKVKGELRLRDWEVLAGDGTETVHREYGYEYRLDITEVYFSPRLATERRRVVEGVGPDERAFDMFAGVGPYAVPMADRGAAVVACDLNAAAVDYCRDNAARNGVDDRLTAVHGDVREVAADWANWADRIVMNLPHSADEFCDTAVALAGDDCVVHLYDIQPDDDPFAASEAAIRAAAEPAYDAEVVERQEVRSYAPHELNVRLDVRLRRR